MDFLTGIGAREWARVLRDNHWGVDRRYWRRGVQLTILSLLNSRWRRREEALHGAAVRRTEIRPPVFVLGHWRNGTTLLHELLALDTRFAYPNWFEATNPHCFLTREEIFARMRARMPARKRPMDNMAITFESPGEDEFGLSVMSLRSPEMGLAFARRQEYYDRYLSFRGVPESELREFTSALTLLLQKLTYKHQRPLILKSPAHTARVAILRKLFPEARFVHIIRDPGVVYRSMIRLYEKTLPGRFLQQPPEGSIEAGILRRYSLMYDAFLNECGAIPEGRFCEVRFEELERDMVGQVARIYRELELPDFEAVRPRLEQHAQSLAGYSKNVYRPLPDAVRASLQAAWGRFFHHWGYAV